MTVFIVVVIMIVDFFRKYMTFNLAHHPKTTTSKTKGTNREEHTHIHTYTHTHTRNVY